MEPGGVWGCLSGAEARFGWGRSKVQKAPQGKIFGGTRYGGGGGGVSPWGGSKVQPLVSWGRSKVPYVWWFKVQNT